jgi:hypothetical protein
VSFSRIAGLNRPEAPYFFVGCIASGIAGAVQPIFAFVVASFITIFYTNNPVSCLSATCVHMCDELNSYTAMQCGVFWQYCDVSSITRLEPHYPTLRMTYCLLLKSVNPLAFLLLYFDVLRFLVCHALFSMCFSHLAFTLTHFLECYALFSVRSMRLMDRCYTSWSTSCITHTHSGSKESIGNES